MIQYKCGTCGTNLGKGEVKTIYKGIENDIEWYQLVCPKCKHWMILKGETVKKEEVKDKAWS